MGNKHTPDKKDLKTRPRPMAEPGPGGPAVAAAETPQSWAFVLEDPKPMALALTPPVAVRGEPAEPRIRVLLGTEQIGFVPAEISAEMHAALSLGGGVLVGRVAQVDSDTAKVRVELRLEGQ